MAAYTTDRDIVIAYQSGDDDAFKVLVHEYRPRLYARARHRLRCPDAAEDAVQEALVRAYKALPRFNGEYKLGPWLQRILDNVCHDESKRRKREDSKAERLINSPDYYLFNESLPEDELRLDFADSDVLTAVEQLPPKYKEALYLRTIQEHSHAEIAEIAGITEENARARVSRSHRMLRSALKGLLALPLIGVLLPLLGKAIAGTALLAVVLTPAGDTTQLQLAPAQPELVRTQEADPNVVGTPDDQGGADTGTSAGTGQEQSVILPDRTDGIAPAGSGNTDTSAGGADPDVIAATDAVAQVDGVQTEGEDGGSVSTVDAADLPPLANGAPLDIAAYNLTVVASPAQPELAQSEAAQSEAAQSEALNVSGVVILTTEDGFVDATLNQASRLVVDPTAQPAGDEQELVTQVKQHALSGVLVIDLPDGTLLKIGLSGAVSHDGSPMLVVQGADLSVDAGFSAVVAVPEGVDVIAREALPLTGDGRFAGTMKIDTRTGSAALTLQRVS